MSGTSRSRAQAAGRIGGLTKAVLHDSRQGTKAARTAFRDSFLAGHGCKVCVRIAIPSDLPLSERERRAEALRKLHFARIALLRKPRRRPPNQ